MVVLIARCIFLLSVLLKALDTCELHVMKLQLVVSLRRCHANCVLYECRLCYEHSRIYC